jgi:hypothetical protein
MMCCRICGESKDESEFVYIKHFKFIKPERVIWCRLCQRMYKRKLELEENIKRMENLKSNFMVKFM